MNDARKSVSMGSLQGFLTAFSISIRELDANHQANLQAEFLVRLDQHIAGLTADESPLLEIDKRNLQTLRAAFQKYLDDPLLLSH